MLITKSPHSPSSSGSGTGAKSLIFVTRFSSASKISSRQPLCLVQQHLADIRHLSGDHERQPAQRIDIFVDQRQLRVDGFGQIVQFGARVGFPQVGGHLHEQQLGFVVMLVFYFADDFFDQILDGDEAFGARIFVEHDGQMCAGAAHFVEERSTLIFCGTKRGWRMKASRLSGVS